MDADAENGRCGDAESYFRECGEEVEGCIFFKGFSRVRSFGQGLFYFYFFLYVV